MAPEEWKKPVCIPSGFPRELGSTGVVAILLGHSRSGPVGWEEVPLGHRLGLWGHSVFRRTGLGKRTPLPVGNLFP